MGIPFPWRRILPDTPARLSSSKLRKQLIMPAPQWSPQKRPCVVSAKAAMPERRPGRVCSTLLPVEEASLFLFASSADRISVYVRDEAIGRAWR
jgi:hypothetical protein